VKAGITVAVVGLALSASAAGYAQTEPPEAPTAAQAPGQPAEQVQARFQIAAMEGVLERAVQLGAQTMRVKVQRVAPEMIFINGAARARGFRLEGYGVFFDVDVPALRRSVLWSARTLDQSDHNRSVELRDLKAQATSVTDPDARQRLLLIINRLEQLEPSGDSAGPRRAAAGGLTTAAAHTTETDAVLEDPGEAYTNEVRNALIDAIVVYSTPFSLAPTEFLTVAARDQEGTRLQPGDPYDVTTVLLRAKGSDLLAYRNGEIDKAEMRKRIQVKEY
jgi:hypothetical protein